MRYNEVNEAMAKFLGWEREEYPSGLPIYYEISDRAKYVAAQELKFDSNWNELMKVVIKIGELPSSSESRKKNEKTVKILLDEFILSTNCCSITAYRWTAENNLDKFSVINFCEKKFPYQSNYNSYLNMVYKTIGEFVLWCYE